MEGVTEQLPKDEISAPVQEQPENFVINLQYDDEEETVPVRKYLTFLVQNVIYGIEVEHVKELIEYNTVYNVPRLADFIRGITNLRGEIIPVVDFASLFFNKASEITIDSGIVFIECSYNGSTELIGLIIDMVKSVEDIPEDRIVAAPELGSNIPARYIKGIGTVDNEFVVLLDITKILDIELLNEKIIQQSNII